MIQLVKSMSEDIATEKMTKNVEYDIVQRKLKESTNTLAEKRKVLERLRSRSEELERVNESIANLEVARDSLEDFDWTGRSHSPEQSVDSNVPSAFRRKKDSQLSSTFSATEIENFVERSSTSLSSGLDDLIMLRRMKIWHERIATLLSKRHASRAGLAVEQEHQLRKLVALCTGFSAMEADEVWCYHVFSSNTYALMIIAS
jgi:hypothetical protein